jgi:macrolide transport system ATP-binding/permease protein
MTGSPLIQLEAVSKRIPGRSSGFALSDGTCQITRGEFVSIVGPSGSGKTTLLSILGLLESPSSGTYRFDGVDVATLTEAQRNRFRGKRLGFVFQNSFVVAEETVASNVALGLAVRGVESRERRQRVAYALDRVGLADFLDKAAGDLSGGEKQRVALARALVTEPDVILADEPTGSLDAESTNRLVELLREINDTGTTVVVVTHDPVVAQAADRQIDLVDGEIIEPTVGALVLPKAAPDQGCPAQDRTRPDRPVGKRRIRYFQEVADALFAPMARPVRSAFVVMAYVLGVTALIGAVGLTQSTTGQIVDRLTAAGSNEIRVSMDSQTPEAVFFDSLDQRGAAQRLSKLTGVDVAVPFVRYVPDQNTVARFPRTSAPRFSGRLVVTDARALHISGLVVDSGRVDLLANPWNGPVVVAGAAAAKELGIPSAGPDIRLWINDRDVAVVATLAPSGDTLADSTLYFSRGVSTVLTGLADKFILVRTSKGYAEPLARAIPLALAPDNPGAVTVSKVAELAQLQQSIDSDLSRLLSIIGWVILVLSALTAATSMFLSIQHRTPEIALRRALGATRSSIWRLFSWEGTAIGCAGGIVGTGLGVLLTWLLTAAQGSVLSLGPRVVGLGFGLGILTGMVASAYPALYASHRDPAEILRSV